MQNPFGNGDDDDQNNNMIPIPPTFAVVKRDDGQMRVAKVGFSWTSLVFGMLPSLFRSDWYNFLSMISIQLIMGMGISMAMGQSFEVAYSVGANICRFIWAGLYNMMYFKHLFAIGYKPADQRSRELLIENHYLKEEQ